MLRRAVRKADWVVPSVGRNASLTNEGYRQVLMSPNDAEMKAFARRIVEEKGYNPYEPFDEHKLSEIVSKHTATTDIGSFADLKSDLIMAEFPSEGTVKLINELVTKDIDHASVNQ